MDTNDATSNDATSEETSPVPDPPPRVLVRYPEQGPGAGVAAGLGAYFGIDPVLFRIGFALLAFAGGTGILLYLLGWVLIPEAEQGAQPGDAAAARPPDEALRWVGIGLVVIAGLWLTAQLDLVRPPVVWALALIVVGVLLFRGDPRTGATRPAAQPSEPSRQGAWGATGTTQHLGGSGATAQATTQEIAPPPSRPAPPPAAPPPPPPQPPPPASPLSRLTVGLTMLAGGVAALLDNAGVLDLRFRHYAALVLLVVGLGLLVGSWWGRARGLVAIGLLLVPLVLFAGVADALWDVRGGVGDRFYSPGDVEEVAASYELFAGQMVLDLSEVDFTGEAVDVAARVSFGQLQVLVPPDVEVEVEAAVGAGEIILPAGARGGDLAPDRPVSGLRVEREAILEGDGAGSLVLDLTAGFGTVAVERSR